MEDENEIRRRVRDLVLAADRHGLTAFEIHPLVRKAFRELREYHLWQLDERLDRAFGRPGTTPQPVDDIQDIAGETMSKPLKEFASGSV